MVSACSGGGASTAPSTRRRRASAAATCRTPSAATSAAPSAAPSVGPAALGPGEGQLNLAVWPYYVVGGTGGEQVAGAPDWVTPFEQKTGCKVNAKVYGGSSDGVALMKTGEYDGGAFSGDATLRLIAGGDVAAVNTALVPNYANVFEGLKGKSHNTVDGVPYGVPHGRGANVLMWRSDIVQPDPDSWSVVWDGGSQYAGKVSAYDYEIYIADAAVYLMATKPELGIKDPYALDATQFQAAVDLLKAQRAEHHDLLERRRSTGRRVHQGRHGRQHHVAGAGQHPGGGQGADRSPRCRRKAAPAGPTPGWSPRRPRTPTACTCGWTTSSRRSPTRPRRSTSVRRRSARRVVPRPRSRAPGTATPSTPTDEEYWKKIYLWNTPSKECLDGRGPICTDFSQWTSAWTEIKG